MVHTTFHSDVYFNKRGSRQVELSYNLYQVIVNGEDGELSCQREQSKACLAMPSAADNARSEYLEYEIESDSHSEASAKAEMLAADAMVDISFIEVYRIH